MGALKDLSIIIPIAPKEEAWRSLLKDLRFVPSEVEIFLVGPEKPPHLEKLKSRSPLAKQIEWIQSPLSRAIQLNQGAQFTKKKFIWFLHADSRLPKESFSALNTALTSDPQALYYFRLVFLNDGTQFTRINTLGVWVRSQYLSLPFGDQGFCISKSLFDELGGYPENTSYGEDHLFVWKVRRAGIPIRAVRGKIYTSSRKYQKNGWARTTLTHGVLTIKQALPEWFKLLTQKGKV
ncbi:MAG: glycosyl transferase family 2 [Pseudobdellovibrionaceae bacterium]